MQPFSFRALVCCTAVLALAACHDHGGEHEVGDGGIAGLMSITVTPASATLTISGTTPVSQTYTATGTFANGKTEDITSELAWSVSDPTAGTFAGPVFTSGVSHGGLLTVIATAGPVSGTAALDLVFQQRYSDPGSSGLPANPSASFGGTPSTADDVTPRLVYPDDNVVVPPNLGALEFHFTPGGDGSATSPNTLFELSLENVVTDIKVYLRCPTPPPYTDAAMTPAVLTVAHGCIYTSDATLWSWIAETNRGGDPLTVSIRGTTDSSGPVATSNSTHVSFTYDDIQGAIYYWEIGRDQPCVDNTPPTGQTGPGCSDTSDSTAIVRYDFAGTDPAGSTFLTPASPGSTAGTCLGCHALSHDGTKLVAEAGGQADGRILLWDVAMEDAIVPFQQADRSFFESWSPDGTQYVGVNNFSDDPAQDGTAGGTACTTNGAGCDLNLRLYDGTTGKFTADVPGTSIDDQLSDHPDWSPDGNSIAYTSVAQVNGAAQGTLQQAYAGSIYLVTRNGSSWGAPVQVVAGPDDHTSYYYPAFSPDGSLLVFNRAQCPAGASLDPTCWFDTAPTSRIFATPPKMGATPIELANADKPGPLDDPSGDITNSYPKWSPFVFKRSAELSSPLLWLTFASKRRFGLRAPPVTANRDADGEILWMTSVDPGKVAAGMDGSSVAFALPFQRLYKSNHIAQWTTKLVPPIQ